MKKMLSDEEASRVVGGVEYTFKTEPEPMEDAEGAGWLKIYPDGVLVETLHYLDASECEMLKETSLTRYYGDGGQL